MITGHLIVISLSLLLNVLTGFAQGNRNRSDTPPVGRGKVETIIDAALPPRSLQELVEHSDLILDGSVVRLLPSRQTLPDDPASLETDLIISPTRTLKGRAGKRILISQLGGERNGLRVETPQIPLMQSGARYILFLTTDARSNLPDHEGLPRYLVTGVWSGLFEVIGNYAYANKNTSQAIKAAVANVDVTEFLNEVISLVR